MIKFWGFEVLGTLFFSIFTKKKLKYLNKILEIKKNLQAINKFLLIFRIFKSAKKIFKQNFVEFFQSIHFQKTFHHLIEFPIRFLNGKKIHQKNVCFLLQSKFSNFLPEIS